MPNPYIDGVTLDSTTYELVDVGARELISQISSTTEFLGETSTAIEDGDTTNPIMINGESVTAKTGDIVLYGSKEFIFNATGHWQEFGDLSVLGTLAYKNSVAVSTTATGSVSSSFTGSSSNVSVSVEASDSGNYTPAGTISNVGVTLNSTSVGSVTDAGSMPSFTVSSNKLVITDGSVPTVSSVSVATASTPTITQPTFTGTKVAISGTVTPSGSVSSTFTGTPASGTVTYTP